MPGKKARRDARLQQSRADKLRTKCYKADTLQPLLAPEAIDTVDCAICLEPHARELLYVLQPCGHHFHFECLRGVYAASKQDSSGCQFRCPLCRRDIESSMDFEAIYDEPQPPVWQWNVSEDSWLSFPARLQHCIEEAQAAGESAVQLGGAGTLDLGGLTFIPAASGAESASQLLRVRRCECLWQVHGILRAEGAPGGYRLNNARWYEPSVSQYIECGYQDFLQDSLKHTITDPSGQYLYCFERRAFALNEKLVAMQQWRQGKPSKARVIMRQGDSRTEPIPPD
eukprot:TRINITY_DN107535_c0_g1_i1.p1 TRINITY_DN107535_c0_g1~~TRINITY_DN107535_c0_g1_i1.p1  ORF type:complete len:284 (+),score=51.18 TRINITY_DN107535_c0_g1_i1:33-884(+)